MSRHLPTLLKIAQETLPQLEYDVNNSTGSLYTIQATLKTMNLVLTYLVHHALLDAEEKGQIRLAPEPVQQPPAPRLPYQQPLHQPPAMPSGPSLPSDVSIGAGPSAPVGGPQTEVFMTAHGTKVVAPGAAPMVVPPGQPVDAASLVRPSIPIGIPTVPTGPAPMEVVLPRGGGMAPETAAAVAAASQTADPTGGARNITTEQPGG